MRFNIILLGLLMSSCSTNPSTNLSINQLKNFEKQNSIETGAQTNKYVREEIEAREKIDINKAQTSNKNLTTGEGYIPKPQVKSKKY